MKVKVVLLVSIIALSFFVFFLLIPQEDIQSFNNDNLEVVGEQAMIPKKEFRAEIFRPLEDGIQKNTLDVKVSPTQLDSQFTNMGTFDDIGGFYDELAMSPESESIQGGKVSSIGRKTPSGMSLGIKSKNMESNWGRIGTAMSESNASPEIDN